ncbi:MAG: prevent-host-death protein [Spirochaetaceae bacterium]|nr:prevent-host-death protein [Spirochaetaceae bacterium]
MKNQISSNSFSQVKKNSEKNIKTLHGKSKKSVAMIVPIKNMDSSRKIGILDGKATFNVNGNGKISEEEFLPR